MIWHGAMVGVVWAEAPHLYAVEAGFLLVIAEGGTADHHSMTLRAIRATSSGRTRTAATTPS